ncbi:MAG: hypothetical protein ACREIN_02885 [Candidatus Methylomirabilaceae bacterium]
MGRSLKLLNVALALVALAIAWALVKSWLIPAPSYSSHASGKPSQELTALSIKRPARSPLSDFDVLLEKNRFKQPPPLPPPPTSKQPQRPAAPLPTLVGTILVDDERRAILSDKGKADIYSIGQEVAGGVITGIREDRITYRRGEESKEIFLKAAIETTPPSATSGQPTAPGTLVAPATPVVPATPALAPPVPPPANPDKIERERRKQEGKAQKQYEKLLRKQSK